MNQANSKKRFRYVDAHGVNIPVARFRSCPRGIVPWIVQFCALPDNSWLVPVDREWIGDWFNQYGIDSQFADFQMCIEMITDAHLDPQWKELTDEQVRELHLHAAKVYGLMHARWITQPKGLQQMKKKYESAAFGRCPRYLCKGTHLLPVGLNFALRKHRAKLFCPQCNDVYTPQNVSIDGAYFGAAFPHIFLCEYTAYNLSDRFCQYPFAWDQNGGIPEKPQHMVHETNIHTEEVV